MSQPPRQPPAQSTQIWLRFVASLLAVAAGTAAVVIVIILLQRTVG
jgi:hypothetical protein